MDEIILPLKQRIRVSVVDYRRQFLQLRWTDPKTGKKLTRSSKTADRPKAKIEAKKLERELNKHIDIESFLERRHREAVPTTPRQKPPKSIRVYVVDYGREFLQFRWTDPQTGRFATRSSKTADRAEARAMADSIEEQLAKFALLPTDSIERRKHLDRLKAAKKRAAKKPVPVVYFIHDEIRSAIKIGFATNLYQRFASIQSSSASPLKLLGAVAGTLDDEAALHQKWHPLLIRGEWFSATPELLEWIKNQLGTT